MRGAEENGIALRQQKWGRHRGRMSFSLSLITIPPWLRRTVVATFFLLMLAGVLWPWWHNHDRINDFYDYGVTIAAVGRMAQGERPYVDFLTPLQTLGFLCSALAEKCFGERYLSLTYLNGLAIVAAMSGFAWVLWRTLGGLTAILVAAAVVAATFTQHSIVWYNALGVAWVALTTWLVAPPEESAPRRLRRWLAVFAVLWLSGMTKVTYHVAAVAFALLFAGRDALRLAVPRKETGLVVIGILLFGGVLPAATEMIYTGATFDVWRHNVFGLAGGRMGLLNTIATRSFYFKPVHDYYRPIYLSAVGLWGALLLGTSMALIGWQIAKRPAARGRDFMLLMMVGGGVFGCAAVFQATNYEIVYLAGATWLALTTGLVLAMGGEAMERGAVAVIRGVLVVAAVGLLVPAWRSAWVGARALFRGMGDALERTTYLSGDDLGDRFAYVRGMSMRQEWHEALRDFGAMLDADHAAGVDRRGYLLTNGAEWLVRVVPEAVHRGMPLWLHGGTTYSAGSLAVISDPLERGTAIHTVVVIKNWDFWGLNLDRPLYERFHTSQGRGLLRVYRLDRDWVRPFSSPLAFRWYVGAELPPERFRVVRGAAEIQYAEDVGFVGGWASNAIEVKPGLGNLEGEAVARLSRWDAPAKAEVVFRAVEELAAGGSRVRWEQRLCPTAGAPMVVAPFAVELGGGRTELQISIPPGVRVDAGWRRFKSRDERISPPQPPPPIQAQVQTVKIEPRWRDALFDGAISHIEEVAARGLQIQPECVGGKWELFTHVGGEIWLKLDGQASRVSGEFGLREGAWKQGGSLRGAIVRVVLVEGPRQQELLRKALVPKEVVADRELQRFELALPPRQDGWLGLIIEPLEPNNYAWGHGWWRRVRIE